MTAARDAATEAARTTSELAQRATDAVRGDDGERMLDDRRIVIAAIAGGVLLTAGAVLTVRALRQRASETRDDQPYESTLRSIGGWERPEVAMQDAAAN